MAAENWKTIWEGSRSRFKRKNETHFITMFYLKQNKKTKQIRLVQWLKDCVTQKSFYANIPMGHLLIDLKKVVENMGKRIRKRGRSGTV